MCRRLVYKFEKHPHTFLKVVSRKMNAKFTTSAQAIQFAKVKFNGEPLDEVLVEECGSKACFRLMRLSNKKIASLIIND